jgi:hypothetical protein
MPPEHRYDRAAIRLNPVGGHVPCGVTAHGSPGGPLQFDRLEAALAAKSTENERVIRKGADIGLHYLLIILILLLFGGGGGYTDIPSGVPSVAVDSSAWHCWSLPPWIPLNG